MCRLCGTPEERSAAQKDEEIRAESLERMAGYSRKLANGTIKPHTDDMKKVSSLARSLICDLVEEYV